MSARPLLFKPGGALRIYDRRAGGMTQAIEPFYECAGLPTAPRFTSIAPDDLRCCTRTQPITRSGIAASTRSLAHQSESSARTVYHEGRWCFGCAPRCILLRIWDRRGDRATRLLDNPRSSSRFPTVSVRSRQILPPEDEHHPPAGRSCFAPPSRSWASAYTEFPAKTEPQPKKSRSKQFGALLAFSQGTAPGPERRSKATSGESRVALTATIPHRAPGSGSV